ncbi:carboxypeptidase-like regulatory domain-containing protein [Polaribacter ponticola]|uniref:Carboxypeptidase-like regulatory domain-containing protein n=1 Tax=Polaribacter ponticola TaxID=2978475 RepID=A0ABT5S586_9FLAO|nr:carboxypeptidase-like regulatory domain-containing protein [Polaribacter sp. MSW5]MDD7913269.1 hypothetical protein [Polaribacter sp. MSW5]
MKKLLFFLLISSQLFGQKINFNGTLLDFETKEPVVYANISFLKTSLGISSLENGTFNLEIDEKLLQEKVHVSCLNYKDTIFLAKDIYNKVLYLKPKRFQLDEIVLSRKIDRELIIDKYKRKDIKGTFGGRQSSPWIVTKYFPYKKEYENISYLKEITVYFGSIFAREKSKFRVRLFKINNSTGFPSEDIISQEIIATSKKINGKVIIDVSKFDIEFPKDGFFVGLERIHIPYNFYEYKYTIQGSKKKHIAKAVAPSFGSVYTKDTTFHFSKGKWRKFYFPTKMYKGNQIEPAISLKLTN